MNILKLLLPVGFVQVRNFSGTYYKFDINCFPKPVVSLLQEMKKLIYIKKKHHYDNIILEKISFLI